MIEIVLTADKQQIYEDVARTTGYAGAKMVGDNDAYERMFTTEADREMLERFWTEACNGVTELLKPFITRLSEENGKYDVQLELSTMFDAQLKESIEKSMRSYMVLGIVSKWFVLTDKQEAESYGAQAMAMLADMKRKLYYRRKPTRRQPV